MSHAAWKSETAEPITPADFAAALEPLAPAGPLALAVSGGGDSMALLVLAAAWAAKRHRLVVALTVDHGLRPDSAAEARTVAEIARRLGVGHETLAWTGLKPRANLQARARAARFALMGNWCRARGMSGLVLGHTRDDQAETFMLRLARGSGVDGLAAMAPRTERAGLLILRPLLDVSRLQLRATLTVAGMPWTEDPSNADARFARVRIRGLMAGLAAEGLTATRLAATARQLGRARSALEAATAELLARAVATDGAGYCRLDPAVLVRAPQEIALRALARVLMAVGGLAYPPRLARLERLLSEVCIGGIGRGRTLGGCRIVPARRGADGALLIVREAASVASEPMPIAPGQSLLWDGRFRVCLHAAAAGPAGPAGFAVGALGAKGSALVRRSQPAAPEPALPGMVRVSLPALWSDEIPVAVPHLGYRDAGSGLARGRFEAIFSGL